MTSATKRRKNRATAIRAAFVLTALFLSARAEAMPTSKITWVKDAGAESCPTEEELRGMVAARLGYNPFRVVADNTLFAEVRRGAPGFVADVKLVDAKGAVRGERHLQSASMDCKDIAQAIALSMSIALDPKSLTRPAGMPPPGVDDAPEEIPAEPAHVDLPPTPPPPPPAPDKAEKPPAPIDANASRVHWSLGIGPTASLGASPQAAVGGSVFGAARIRWASLELGVHADLPSGRSTAEGGSAETRIFAGTAAACGHTGPLALCIASQIGDVNGRATSVTAPKTQDFFFAAIGPRLGASVPVGDVFELRFTGDALFVVTPFDLTLNQKVIYSSSPVSALFALSAIFHFS